MIFESNNQLNNLLIFVFIGILVGIISIFYFLFFAAKFQKKPIKLIFFTVFYLFFTVFYVFLINFFNFGKFSFVLFFAFMIGYIWIRQLTSNLVVILENKWYTTLNKLFKHNFKREGKNKKHERENKS